MSFLGFGRRVSPDAQQRIRQYLRDTSVLLARHTRAADDWDNILRRALDGLPEGALVSSSPTGPELLPRAKELIPLADGFVDESSRVTVPDEALDAHASFLRMFLSWQRWANATVNTFSAGDAAGQTEFVEMASVQEESQRATQQHHDDIRKMLKDYRLPASEGERLMREALED